MPLMFLHVIVHGILVLLDLRADSTDKLTSSILLISVRHLYLVAGATGLQFFPGLVSLLAVTIMAATAVGVFRESFFCGISAAGAMILFCGRGFFTCCGVDID